MLLTALGLVFIIVLITVVWVLVTQDDGYYSNDVQEIDYIVSHEVAQLEQKFDKDFDKNLKKRHYIIADVNEAKMMGNKKCHRKGRKGTTLSDKRRQGRYVHDDVDLESLAQELIT